MAGSIDVDAAVSPSSIEDELVEARMLELGRRRFGIHAFRPGQSLTIRNVLGSVDSLAIMPTGGGKSLCYQLPALELDGITLVVSPLIALMKDQHDKLAELGLEVVRLDSTLSPRDEITALERLSCGVPLHRLRHAGAAGRPGVPRAAVARAGRAVRGRRGALHLAVGARLPPGLPRPGRRGAYDGTPAGACADRDRAAAGQGRHPRPARHRRRIGGRRRPAAPQPLLPRADRARRAQETVDAAPPARPRGGLRHHLRRHREDGGRAGRLPGPERRRVRPLPRPHARARARRGADRVHGARLAAHHGGDQRLRPRRGQAGPALRHPLQLPGSLESYYQEAGRAGRDGFRARCVLLYQLEDKRIQSFFLGGRYPTPEQTKSVADALVSLYKRTGEPQPLREIAESADAPGKKTRVVLSFLKETGFAQEVNGGSFVPLGEEPPQLDELARAAHRYEQKRAPGPRPPSVDAALRAVSSVPQPAPAHLLRLRRGRRRGVRPVRQLPARRARARPSASRSPGRRATARGRRPRRRWSRSWPASERAAIRRSPSRWSGGAAAPPAARSTWATW